MQELEHALDRHFLLLAASFSGRLLYNRLALKRESDPNRLVSLLLEERQIGQRSLRSRLGKSLAYMVRCS